MRYTDEFDNSNDTVDLYSHTRYEDISSSSKGPNKRKHKKKKKTTVMIATVCIILSVIILLVGSGYLYAFSIIDNVERIPLETEDLEELNIATSTYSSVKNIALLGIDSRSDNDSGRSDAIVVLSIDKKHNKIKLTSIARDTCVEIDGKGKDKITHAYAFGKSTLAVKTLNKNFGLEITDYVTINFYEFARIIDYIGGVEIDINKKEMDHLNSYVIPKLMKQTDIKCDPIPKTGKQILSGAQALCFSRIRKIDGDIERGNRQKEVLEAMFNRVKGTSVTKLPSVAEMVLSQCQTSLSTQDIMGLGLWAVSSKPSIENMSVPNKDIPSKGKTINGSWQYVYDLELASKEMEKFILETAEETK